MRLWFFIFVSLSRVRAAGLPMMAETESSRLLQSEEGHPSIESRIAPCAPVERCCRAGFNPVFDRYGSIASCRDARTWHRMSALRTDRIDAPQRNVALCHVWTAPG